MYDRIDEIVDKNLPLFLKKKLGQVYYSSFTNLEGEGVDHIEGSRIAGYMESEGLITTIPNGDRCDLTKKGYEVAKIGWLNFLDQVEKKKQELLEEEKLKLNQQIRKEVQEEWIRRETIKKFRYDKIAFYVSITAAIISLLALLLK